MITPVLTKENKASTTNLNITSSNENKNFKCIYMSEIMKKQNSPDDVDMAQVHAKFEQDVKRLAQFMGIGPQTLLKVIGKLDIDPKNYNFKIVSKSDGAINSIAQYFGISPMTMIAIFDKLGITRKDLTDEEEAGKIIVRLKDLFHLNLDQEKDLKKILNEYKKKEDED